MRSILWFYKKGSGDSWHILHAGSGVMSLIGVCGHEEKRFIPDFRGGYRENEFEIKISPEEACEVCNRFAILWELQE